MGKMSTRAYLILTRTIEPIFFFYLISFLDIYGISVVCLLCFCVRLFIFVLWSPAGKGLTAWLSYVKSNCEFVTFPLVSWVRFGT